MNRNSVKMLVLLAGVFLTVTAWGADIYVPGDYTAIQDAVDAAATGDTVHVAAGTYSENVLIQSKSIHLIGESRRTTVIDGGGLDSVVHIYLADDVTVSGFTLRHPGNKPPSSGILQEYSGGSTLSNNRIVGSQRGIFLYHATSSTVMDNSLDGQDYQGIMLIRSTDNLVEGNTLENLERNAIKLDQGTSGNTISNNHVRGAEYGAVIIKTTGNTLTGNTFLNCAENGIYCYLADDNIITGNTCASCTFSGIYIISQHCLISENVCFSNKYGLWIIEPNNTVSNNTIEFNSDWGIYIDCDKYESGGAIINNRINGNVRGITIRADGTTVRGNTVSHNLKGMQIYNFTEGCLVYENTFADNLNRGLEVISSKPNYVYHNNFSGNLVDAYEEGINSVWDNGYPDGGNFWSDYMGVDLDGDGIGDSPQTISSGSGSPVDQYPLMVPWGGGMLHGHTYQIPASTGGTVNLKLEAAENNANRYYLILGSLTGTDPGIPLPGGLATLPLTRDAFTDLSLTNVNTPTFADFLGMLDASGKATAHFKYTKTIKPHYIGRSIYFAYTLADPGPFDYVSQPMEVRIVDY